MFRAHVPIIIYRCDDTRGCVMQFWLTDDEHICSKHVEAWNKLTVKQKFCASSWLIIEINILRCTVSKTSKNYGNMFRPFTVETCCRNVIWLHISLHWYIVVYWRYINTSYRFVATQRDGLCKKKKKKKTSSPCCNTTTTMTATVRHFEATLGKANVL